MSNETATRLHVIFANSGVRVVDAETGETVMLPEYGPGIIAILVTLMEAQGISYVHSSGDAVPASGSTPTFTLDPVGIWDDANILHFQETIGLDDSIAFAEPLPDDVYRLRGEDGEAHGWIMDFETAARVFDIDYADGFVPGATVRAGWIDFNGDGDIDGTDLRAAGEATADILSGEAALVYVDIWERDVYLDDFIIGAVAFDANDDGRVESIDMLLGDLDGDGLADDRALRIDAAHDFDGDGTIDRADARAYLDVLYESGLLVAEAELLLA